MDFTRDYAISDDEETEFAQLYPTGEVSIEDKIWMMNLVEGNRPEDYFSLMQLDCRSRPVKTSSIKESKQLAEPVSFDDLFPGMYRHVNS